MLRGKGPLISLIKEGQLLTFIWQIGNKCDLEENRVVSQEEGKALAKSIGAHFMETSAKTGYNIDRAFLGTQSTSPCFIIMVLLIYSSVLAGAVLSRMRQKENTSSERATIAKTRNWCVLCWVGTLASASRAFCAKVDTATTVLSSLSSEATRKANHFHSFVVLASEQVARMMEQQHKQLDLLTSLPTEIALHILRHCDTKTLCMLASVSHSWKR